jgi:hypothetical protein
MRAYEFTKPILLEYNRDITLSNTKIKENLVRKLFSLEFTNLFSQWYRKDEMIHMAIETVQDQIKRRSNPSPDSQINNLASQLAITYPDNVARVPLPQDLQNKINEFANPPTKTINMKRTPLNIDLDLLLNNKIMPIIEGNFDSRVHKYIPWVLREYIKNNIQRLEDLTDVNQVLLLYEQNKKRRGFPEEAKNITNVDFLTLREIVRKYDPNDPYGYSQNMGDYEVIYGDIDINTDENGVITAKPASDWVIIHPKDKDAGIYFGRYFGGFAEWCTAYIPPRTNQFDFYNDIGPMYILVPGKPRQTNEKYQFHPKDKQYKDKNDHDVNPGLLAYEKFRDNTELKESLSSVVTPLQDSVYFVDTDVITGLWKSVGEAALMLLEQEMRRLERLEMNNSAYYLWVVRHAIIKGYFDDEVSNDQKQKLLAWANAENFLNEENFPYPSYFDIQKIKNDPYFKFTNFNKDAQGLVNILTYRMKNYSYEDIIRYFKLFDDRYNNNNSVKTVTYDFIRIYRYVLSTFYPNREYSNGRLPSSLVQFIDNLSGHILINRSNEKDFLVNPSGVYYKLDSVGPYSILTLGEPTDYGRD